MTRIGPKILHLTPGCFDKGGISRYSRYQISSLRRICGVENVKVLSLLGPDDNRLEEDFAVEWHGPEGGGSATRRDRLAFASRAVGLASRWRPDLVWSAHVNFGPLQAMAARLAGARSVLNVYGLEIWSGLTAPRRACMGRTDRVIADCHFTANYVTENGLHTRPPEVIWDPVDLDRFLPGEPDRDLRRKYGIPDPEAHFIVMTLGRLAKIAAHKGYDRLIEVVASVIPERPELRLVIAGRGDDRSRLEALATRLGVRECVHFSGAIDEADLAGVYRCAHVFSLVSDRGAGRGEGLPLTPLEAMACGVPVIVGDEDGSQEAICGDRNGFIVSPRDAVGHAAVLLRLARNRSLRSGMAEEAVAVARERFGLEAFTRKHAAFLSDL